MIYLFLLCALEAFAFDDSNFTFVNPPNRIERKKMFGSDVMLLKVNKEGEGPIFIKQIEDPEIKLNPKQFLYKKIISSKSVIPESSPDILQERVNGIDLFYSSYVDNKSDQQVFNGILVKDDKTYVFFMYKDNKVFFPSEVKNLLITLKSFKFKK